MKLFCGHVIAGARRGLRFTGAAVLLWALAGGTVGAAADDDEAEPLVQIPDRDEAQIAQARAQILARTTLPAEVAGIATVIDRAIDPAAHLEAMRLVERFRGQSGALANAAAIAWVQHSPEQALLLAAEAAKAAPDDANALNTLAALLAQAGYEGKAIPVLRYLAQKVPDDPTVLSNLAVAWLNLGEIEEAKKILFRCLALAPGHGTANLAAGIIAEHEGRHAEAVAHFKKAAASNSSMQARHVLKQQKQSFRSPKGFFGMMPKQEYFSPSAFAPVKAQKSLEEYEIKKAEKAGYEAELLRLVTEQDKIIQHETLKLMTDVSGGDVAEARSVYGKLDWTNHLKAMKVEQQLTLAIKRMAERSQATLEQLVILEATPQLKFREEVPMCERQRPRAREILALKSAGYEKVVEETLYLWRDATNTQLTYSRFILPPTAYRIGFAGQVSAYLGFVHTLNSGLPLVPDPCAGQDLTRAAKFELMPPGSGPCPFSLDVHAVVATLHMDCHSFGFDFEAGLKFGVTKDFTSGETTLTAGTGAKMDLGGIGSAEVTGQMVMVWDAGNDLSYVGVEAIAAAKISSGIPGLSGTLDLGSDSGADSEGPSITANGPKLVDDLVKVSSDTKLGVTIGPKGCDPTLSGELSGKLLGQDIFTATIP